MVHYFAVRRNGIAIGDLARIVGQEDGIAHLVEVIEAARTIRGFDAVEQFAVRQVDVISLISLVVPASNGDRRKIGGVIHDVALGSPRGVAGPHRAQSVVGHCGGVHRVSKSGEPRGEIPGEGPVDLRGDAAHSVVAGGGKAAAGRIGEVLHAIAKHRLQGQLALGRNHTASRVALERDRAQAAIGDVGHIAGGIVTPDVFHAIRI